VGHEPGTDVFECERGTVEKFQQINTFLELNERNWKVPGVFNYRRQ